MFSQASKIRQNSHFRNKLNCIYNFWENNTEALVISKRLKFPQDDRTDTNFIAPLRMHLYRSKITLDRLKRFFNAFRRNRRWVPLPIVWIASARLHLERKRKLYRYFVNGTTQSRSCFRCPKKYQYYLKEIFHRNFRENGKRATCLQPVYRRPPSL